jgi:hypothetical protein
LIHRRLLLGLLALGLWPTAARAADVQFEGYYRARLRVYDTLSLDRDLANSEGMALYAQHRLWLRPKFVLDEHTRVQLDLRGLDGVDWGDEDASVIDPVTGEAILPELADSLQPPTGDDGSPPLDISLWRAWAEFDTSIGRFSFGRQPLHWGAGVWQNDGLGYNADYGDTTDRVAWEDTFDDVWVRVAVDVNAENLVNSEDDTTSFNGAVGYRSEVVTAGLQTQLRRTPIRGFNIFTADAALEAEIGTIDAKAELVGQFGGGNLTTGETDATYQAFGAVVDVGLSFDPWTVALEGGFASGDKDDNDQDYRTFAFDRDYNVGIVMFEQTMPTLAEAPGTDNTTGRNTSVALTGNAVSNAMYLRPRISRGIVEGLTAEASVIAARVASVPERLEARKGYGYEVDAGVRYEPLEHVDLSGTFALFLPGSYYSEYADEDYSGFEDPVFAGQIIGRVRF